MKKLYLATICFSPPILFLLIPAIFIFRLFPFPSDIAPYVFWYYQFGILVLIVDLWRSKAKKESKILWTVLILFAGLVTLPIYWFLFIKNNVEGAADGDAEEAAD